MKRCFASVFFGLLLMQTSLFSVIVLNGQKIAKPPSMYTDSVVTKPPRDDDFSVKAFMSSFYIN